MGPQHYLSKSCTYEEKVQAHSRAVGNRSQFLKYQNQTLSSQVASLAELRSMETQLGSEKREERPKTDPKAPQEPRERGDQGKLLAGWLELHTSSLSGCPPGSYRMRKERGRRQPCVSLLSLQETPEENNLKGRICFSLGFQELQSMVDWLHYYGPMVSIASWRKGVVGQSSSSHGCWGQRETGADQDKVPFKGHAPLTNFLHLGS